MAFSSTCVIERAQSTDDIALRNAAGEVDRSILLMRVAQWRGAETTERNAQNRFTQAASAAKAAIDELEKVASSDVKDLLPMLRDGIDACVAAFNMTFEDHAKLATMVTEELRPQITQSLAQLREASVAMKANFAAAAKSGGATLAKTALVQQILAFAVLLTGALLAVLIGQGIATPLARITAAMGTLAQGNLTVNVPGIDRKDEVGSMAEAVNVFKENAVERARLERETAAARTAAEAERERTAAERARAAEEQAQVVRRLGEGLKNARRGRFDVPPRRRLRRLLRADPKRFQRGDRQAEGNHVGGRLQRRHDPDRNARNFLRLRRSVAAHRAAGGQAGGDRGATDRDHRKR